MKIGVPGEFHEDRWQRTAEDSERRLLPRTREAGGSHRIQVISCLSVLLTGLRHDDPTYRYLRDILAWRRGLPAALRHGDHAHRHLRGILAWRRGLLAGLRHGDLAYRHLRAIPACQRGFKAEKSSDLRAARRNGLRAGRRSDLKAGRRRGAPRRR